MVVAAFVLYAVGLLLLFGLRTLVHRRRTGSSGFNRIAGTPAEVGWWASVLFVLAIVVGLIGVVVPLVDRGTAGPAGVWGYVGVVVALAGLAGALAGQHGMGASWRIGVDPTERTTLVTTGIYRFVRNPIFTCMVAAQIGVTLMVPSVLMVVGVVVLIIAVELQVRFVEEPYLRQVHAEAFIDYSAGSGRFVPFVG